MRLAAAPVFALLAGTASAQTAALPPFAQEELICERAAKDHFGPPWTEQGVVSRDLKKVVWISRRNGPWVIVVNGEALGPAADEANRWELSPDGQEVLRAGKQGKAWFVWKNGEQVAGPFDEVRGVRFTDDNRPAFAARRVKAWTWFVDGEEQPVSSSDLGPLAVAGKRVAYGVKRADGWHLVLDGKEGPAFLNLADLTFSADGGRFAYLGQRKEGLVAVVDGKEEPPRTFVHKPRFSADGKRVALLTVETPKAGAFGQVVADGVPSRNWPALLQNIEDAARVALYDLGFFGFWNPPTPAPWLTGASAPLFRPDGKLVYAARSVAPKEKFKTQGGGLELVSTFAEARGAEGIWVEGEDKPLYPASLVMNGPVLSEDGSHLAWVELDVAAGRWTGYLDGAAGPSVPSVPKRTNDAYKVTVSGDGTQLAFVHVAGGGGFARGVAAHALRQVVASGRQEKAWDAEAVTNLRFSEDGKHFAYEVHGAKGYETPGRKYGSFVVLDGVAGRVYSEVSADSLRFIAPDRVAYAARIQEVKDGPFRYFRVTQAAAAAKP